jgi:hypothetical protein
MSKCFRAKWHHPIIVILKNLHAKLTKFGNKAPIVPLLTETTDSKFRTADDRTELDSDKRDSDTYLLFVLSVCM